jgi:diguanylate cyclase (GGDEF)-like protein
MSLLSYFRNQPKALLIAIGLALVALAGIVDHLTGVDMSFLLFYLIPVSFFVWFTTRRMGVLVAALCVLIWAVENLTDKAHLLYANTSYLNMSIQCVFFFLVTYLLCVLKDALGINEELGRVDSLTGAMNRAAFYDMAGHEINMLARYNHPITVANVDIDNFRVVNYQFGYQTGDKLLRSVAQTIRSNLRKVDIVSRFGGDEFAILLPETGAEPAQVVLSRIRNILLNIMEQNKWPVTFSFGTVTFMKAPASVEEMMKKVVATMYTAKDSGMNTIEQEVVNA